MSAVELEETSNDTTIISEILNSSEIMQTSTVLTTDAHDMKIPLQRKHPLQIISDTDSIGVTFSDAAKHNGIESLQKDLRTANGKFLNCEYSGADDLKKIDIRHMHIPYILNGELYQIQTQDGENVTVKCCHCPPHRVYRGSVRSTGNFHMHIKRRHPYLLEKLHDMKVNALLERRDRLLRNRKIGHRNNRCRSSNNIFNTSRNYPFGSEDKSELTASAVSQQLSLDSTETGLIQSHNLKIKTVFQRHQMEQREAAEVQNWKNTKYVVIPVGKMQPDEECEQPINYSTKSGENHTALETLSSNFKDSNKKSQEQQEQIQSLDNTIETIADNFTNLSNQPTTLPPINNDMEIVYENHTKKRNLSSTSTSISCSSTMSNYSNGYQYGIETNRAYNSYSVQHNNLSIIKPEQMLLGAEAEAIDLTMHNDSGVFSNSEYNDSECNKDSRINNNRVSSQQSSNINTTTVGADCSNDSGTNIAKWQDLLLQIENSLRGIQREINVRNQIESNRMFLDFAKFKFLNPGFQFNW